MEGIAPDRFLAPVGREGWNSPAFQAGLYELLAERTARYTMGEHSSVPVELAQELLASVCFLVGTALELDPAATLDRPPRELFERGLALVRGLVPPTRRLCERLRAGAVQSGFGNLALRDTLEGMGDFFRGYYPDFFAHDISCSIDYPLADPVPERLAGVRYLNEYLRRLRVEDRFVRALPPGPAGRLLTLYVPDHRVQLINLFEPLFAGAAGLALLGRDPRALLVGRDDLVRLEALFASGEGAVRADLEAASDRLAALFGLDLPGEKDYLRRCAGLLAPRVWHAVGSGGLDGVFLGEAAPSSQLGVTRPD